VVLEVCCFWIQIQGYRAAVVWLSRDRCQRICRLIQGLGSMSPHLEQSCDGASRGPEINPTCRPLLCCFLPTACTDHKSAKCVTWGQKQWNMVYSIVYDYHFTFPHHDKTSEYLEDLVIPGTAWKYGLQHWILDACSHEMAPLCVLILSFHWTFQCSPYLSTDAQNIAYVFPWHAFALKTGIYPCGSYTLPVSWKTQYGCPSKHDNFTPFMQYVVRFFKLPSIFCPLLLGRYVLQKCSKYFAKPCIFTRSSAVEPNFRHCILYSTTANALWLCVQMDRLWALYHAEGVLDVLPELHWSQR